MSFIRKAGSGQAAVVRTACEIADLSVPFHRFRRGRGVKCREKIKNFFLGGCGSKCDLRGHRIMPKIVEKRRGLRNDVQDSKKTTAESVKKTIGNRTVPIVCDHTARVSVIWKTPVCADLILRSESLQQCADGIFSCAVFVQQAIGNAGRLPESAPDAGSVCIGRGSRAGGSSEVRVIGGACISAGWCVILDNAEPFQDDSGLFAVCVRQGERPAFLHVTVDAGKVGIGSRGKVDIGMTVQCEVNARGGFISDAVGNLRCAFRCCDREL